MPPGRWLVRAGASSQRSDRGRLESVVRCRRRRWRRPSTQLGRICRTDPVVERTRLSDATARRRCYSSSETNSLFLISATPSTFLTNSNRKMRPYITATTTGVTRGDVLPVSSVTTVLHRGRRSRCAVRWWPHQRHATVRRVSGETVLSSIRGAMWRTDEITTKRDAALLFAGRGSPRVIVTALAVSIVLRLSLGQMTFADVVVIVVTFAMIGVVEWFVHRSLLHAAERSWTSRWLGLGRRHRTHHLDPLDVEYLLLRGVDAVLAVVALVAATAIWVSILTAALRVGGLPSPTLAPVVTASAAALVALCHYEWTHLLVHTRYRPRSRFYGRRARNHRLHHFRNEAYWFGVTTNVGDRLLGTLPADRDVAMSGTARKLR